MWWTIPQKNGNRIWFVRSHSFWRHQMPLLFRSNGNNLWRRLSTRPYFYMRSGKIVFAVCIAKCANERQYGRRTLTYFYFVCILFVWTQAKIMRKDFLENLWIAFLRYLESDLFIANIYWESRHRKSTVNWACKWNSFNAETYDRSSRRWDAIFDPMHL